MINKFVIYSKFPPFIDDDPNCGCQDFSGDPCGYSVELNGNLIAEYGDNYHDNGFDKAQAFVEGYVWALSWRKGVHYQIEYYNRTVENETT